APPSPVFSNRVFRLRDCDNEEQRGTDMSSNNKKLVAVIGATGQQGGGVVRALQASSQFKVRALSRNPGKHRELADEVVEADLNRPETLKAAFEGAHGVFLEFKVSDKTWRIQDFRRPLMLSLQ